MTLTVHLQEDDQRQLEVNIEVAEERVEKAMKQKARQLARDFNFPGFRRGKAPYKAVLKRFGPEQVRAEVVDSLLQDVVTETLEQEDIQPYAQPMLTEIEMEPLVLKLLVPLAPVVTLDEAYRTIEKPFEVEPVSEEAVDTAVEGFLQGLATSEDAERPAELGDYVTLSGHGALLPLADADADEAVEDDGEPLSHEAEETIFHDHDGIEFLLDAEKTYPGTGFVEAIVGSEMGDMLKFDITFPDDYTEDGFAGRQARFSLLVVAVKTHHVPELTDELAQEHGHDSIEDLRVAKRADLEEAAKQEARTEFLEEMIDELLKLAEVSYPPAAVTHELDHSVEQLKKQVEQYGMKWDDYLRGQGKTVEDLHEEWRPDVERNLERSFVLSEFIQAERLKIADVELDTAVDKQLTMFGDLSEFDEEMQQSLRQMFASGQNLQSMANGLMVDKVLDRMLLIAAGDPPDIDTLEAEAEEAAEAARLAREQARLEAEKARLEKEQALLEAEVASLEQEKALLEAEAEMAEDAETEESVDGDDDAVESESAPEIEENELDTAVVDEDDNEEEEKPAEA